MIGNGVFILLIGGVMLATYFLTAKDNSYVLMGSGRRKKQLPPVPGFSYHSFNELNIDKTDVASILQRYFPYYVTLDDRSRSRFVQRMLRFMRSKMFLLPIEGAVKEMPVLACASAIQISFGLEQYQFPNYYFIRIYNEHYFKKGTIDVLAGHVYGNTITLSWNFFVDGYASPGDGHNLGLHEMAHAFEISYLIHSRNKKRKTLYKGLQTEMLRVFEIKDTRLYPEYAFRSLHEFFASSVELFFERPTELAAAYAGIYHSLRTLLQQDPARSIK